MLSLFSPLVPSHRISFSRKVLRIALFSVFCALLIAPSLPAQAQNFRAGIGKTGDFFFSVQISSMPQNTDTITINVWHGGWKIIGPSSYQVTKNKAPFSINIGNLWSDDFHPSRSLIKPGTTYGVEAEAIRGTQTVGYQWFTLTTTAERECYQITGSTFYHNCPEVSISHENHSDSTLKFRIVKVPGADYYKVPSQYTCGVALDQGYPGHLTGLGELLKWTPGKRVIKSLDFTDMFEDDYTVYYSCLRANHTFQVTIEAHQYYTVTGVSNGRSFTSKQSRLIAKSTTVMSTKPRTASSQQQAEQLGQQLAPTATPSPTPIPPIYVEVDYHGNHDTDVTLSWTAPSCIVSDYNGVLSYSQKDALWDRYFTLAPQRLRQPAELYKIVKRA